MPTTSQPDHATRRGSHRLTLSQLLEIASGAGSPEAIEVLTASQRSKRRILLLVLVKRALESGGAMAEAVRNAWRLLTDAEAARPDAVRPILAHPCVDNWASQCLRLMADREGAAVGPVNHLMMLAVAAATRARLSFEVEVRVSDRVVLPTLGAVVGLAAGPVRIIGEPDRLVFTGSCGRRVAVSAPFDAGTDGWAPIRQIALDDGYSLAIEDLDPYRDCYPSPPTERLDQEAANRFSARTHDAWSIVAEHYAEHASGMRIALASLVPLSPVSGVASQGATSFRAFGSLAVSVNAEPEPLALSLVHEFMHMKLSALLDLVDLCTGDGEARHFAPWRPDKRPVGALLHGAYAHAAVCDYWRRRRGSLRDPAETRSAHFEFALWRRLTGAAVESLLRSGELTDIGTMFVETVRRRIEKWDDEPIPADIDRAAEDAAMAYTVRWRLAHPQPDNEAIDQLLATTPPTWLPEPLRVTELLAAEPDRRLPVVPAKAAEPDLAALIRSWVTGDVAAHTPTRPAVRSPMDDILLDRANNAYLSGDVGAAAQVFAQLVQRGQREAWVGLLVALRRAGRATSLVERLPELAPLAYAAAAPGADPLAVTEWVEAAMSNRPRAA